MFERSLRQAEMLEVFSGRVLRHGGIVAIGASVFLMGMSLLAAAYRRKLF